MGINESGLLESRGHNSHLAPVDRGPLNWFNAHDVCAHHADEDAASFTHAPRSKRVREKARETRGPREIWTTFPVRYGHDADDETRCEKWVSSTIFGAKSCSSVRVSIGTEDAVIEYVEQILRDAADKTCSEKRISVDHGPDFETVGIGSSFFALFSSCSGHARHFCFAPFLKRRNTICIIFLSPFENRNPAWKYQLII